MSDPEILDQFFQFKIGDYAVHRCPDLLRPQTKKNEDGERRATMRLPFLITGRWIEQCSGGIQISYTGRYIHFEPALGSRLRIAPGLEVKRILAVELERYTEEEQEMVVKKSSW